MQSENRCRTARSACALFLATALAGARIATAAVAPEGDPVAARAMGHPDLFVASVHLPLAEISPALASTLRLSLSRLSVNPDLAGFDLRAGRFGSLVAKIPLVPGSGVGNSLSWGALGRLAPPTDAAYRDAVWQAFRGWLQANQTVLGVSAAELSSPNVSSYDSNRVVHVYAGRVFGGVPVRDSFVKVTLNSGNLVLYATRNWGAIDVSTTPSVTASAATDVLRGHLSGFPVTPSGSPQLVIVPLLSGAAPETAVGSGYAYRLAWSIGATVAGSQGSWEALVDTKTGELLSFHDRNSYVDQKKIVGGVYPVSNDGLSPNGVPDGLEQPGYPMSRATVTQLSNGAQVTAGSEGLVNVSGEYRTTLTGPAVRILDQCGAADERSTCDALDLGTGPARDCARPSGHSFGDTHSARTGFYELNRLIDQAKSWIGPTALNTLPTVGWLNIQFPANMNIENACNAFFSPADTTAPTTGSINFYRQGNLGSNFCRNTGEIPAVFDHEWGHGLDTFDNSKGVSLPGEFYADAASIVRLNQSCIARGFFADNTTGGFCPGNGDVCTECTGVREVDWMKRASGFPHDLAWIVDQNPTVPGNCGADMVPPTPFNAGPCRKNTHCEGSVIGEAFWDLLKRDLPCNTRGWELAAGGSVNGGRCRGGAPTIDERTALILMTRLFYVAGPGVVAGYQCDVRVGGCNADSWYFNLLAADDDDGAIENGTPHMDAIYDAFRRHGVACRAPLPATAGCTNTPAPGAAPVVTGVAGSRSATITWTAVPNAFEYWVLRTNGVHGCDTGKTRLARIPASAPRTFTQTDLLEGLTYDYSVVAVGGLAATGSVNDACSGPMSDCAAVTPLDPTQAPGMCVAPANRAPNAADDALTAPSGHPHKLNLLANDTDPDNDLFQVASVTTPAHGQATVDATGAVFYTSAAGFTGSDTFQYVLSDGRGGTDTATVTLAVAGDPCAGGFTVLTDPSGDSTGGRPEHDVVSASVAQTADGKFVFILKMSGMTAPTPDTTWPITFAVDGDFPSYRFVKMAFGTQTCLPVSTSNPTAGVNTAPCFAYGNGDPGAAGTPADASSSFSADGTIRIVVPASALGNPAPGRQLKAFLTRIRIDGGAVLLFPDNMPNSAIPAGTYTVTSCGQ
jgi:hypothetical protein